MGHSDFYQTTEKHFECISLSRVVRSQWHWVLQAIEFEGVQHNTRSALTAWRIKFFGLIATLQAKQHNDVEGLSISQTV